MQEIYTDYLMIQNGQASATKLSRTLKGRISHDRISRFLNKNKFSSKDLWNYIKPKISKICKKNLGFLILDDTISEKPHTKVNSINCWHFDHSKSTYQKGINILTSFYSNNEINLPVGYEIINKDKFVKDKKTNTQKRKATISKNEHFRSLLEQSVKNKLKYEYILADSWYGSKDNMNFIDYSLEKKFVLGIKSNRLFKMYRESGNEDTKYLQLNDPKTNLEADRSYLIKLKGINYPLTLLKKIFKNGGGSTGTLYLVSNDLKLNNLDLYGYYQKRWNIESFHKSIKNNASLSNSPTIVIKTQSNHIYMSMVAYCKLEMLRHDTIFCSHYSLKEWLFINSYQAALEELRKN